MTTRRAESNNSAIYFAVGVNVSGLLGSGLTLQLNGGNDLPIGANGRYEFATRILRGAGYAVTVKTPSGRFREKCLLANAARGNLQADAIVSVSCTLLDGFLYVVDFSRQLQAYGILPTPTGEFALCVTIANYQTRRASNRFAGRLRIGPSSSGPCKESRTSSTWPRARKLPKT